jgi:uncharacterized protein YhaN
VPGCTDEPSGGGYDLPVVLDDVLMTSDDARASLALAAISEFSKGQQVIVLHAHPAAPPSAPACGA